MQPEVVAFFDEDTFTVSYVTSDPETRRCAIIDSVLDFDQASGRTRHDSADRIIAHVEQHGFTVDWVLETHVHADHVSAGDYLKHRLGGQSAIGEHVRVVQNTFARIFNAGPDFSPDGRQFDRLFKDGDAFKIGQLDARVIHTPGHTPACITYVIGDAAFVGDTLFMPDYGTARCDFPGGDAAVLYRSIHKLFALPSETRIFLCHDYKAPGRDEHRWETTVAEQRAKNVHIHDGVSEDEFVAMRTSRDKTLSMPKLILPSVQINMRAGTLPEPESNGVRYLKLPVDAF
ncbi:MBL fold metallo-hydrolase [Dongia sedimenti]|uniref:MBL fold metallo-hydrolase n=1 Tax=Dongia sedimenti TaxID=3064282 RepID=A0ABU0YIL7_9PROT|nr:MBL fold metallo-hydrolase [Rhodospirillaceae bacterium R-7]